MSEHDEQRGADGGTRFGALAGGLRNAMGSLGAFLRRPPRKAGPYVIVITGASVGIGLALARRLLETEHRLVLTARAASLQRFEAAGILPSERVALMPLDVTSADERRALVDAVVTRFGSIDVLVNNAGISYRSVVEHVTERERLAQMNVNFRSPMALTALCLPHMRAQRFGRIVNVSSVGGMSAMPTMAVYSASKFALEGASEALYYEVRPWGITVTLVEPGFINSDGFEKVRFTEQGDVARVDSSDPYHHHYRNMQQLVGKLMTLTWQRPEHVAATIHRTLERRSPPLRVAGTPDARMFHLARRMLPQRVYHALLYAGLPRIWEWGDR